MQLGEPVQGVEESERDGQCDQVNREKRGVDPAPLSQVVFRGDTADKTRLSHGRAGTFRAVQRSRLTGGFRCGR